MGEQWPPVIDDRVRIRMMRLTGKVVEVVRGVGGWDEYVVELDSLAGSGDTTLKPHAFERHRFRLEELERFAP